MCDPCENCGWEQGDHPDWTDADEGEVECNQVLHTSAHEIVSMVCHQQYRDVFEIALAWRAGGASSQIRELETIAKNDPSPYVRAGVARFIEAVGGGGNA